jgi:hypothetical protein
MDMEPTFLELSTELSQGQKAASWLEAARNHLQLDPLTSDGERTHFGGYLNTLEQIMLIFPAVEEDIADLYDARQTETETSDYDPIGAHVAFIPEYLRILSTIIKEAS